MKRSLALFLTLLFLISLFTAHGNVHAVSSDASAEENLPERSSSYSDDTDTRATMTYTPSSYYSDSVYYRNLRELKLTGNQRLDLINVALSQVGYHEGDRKSELDGSNNSGRLNYTEYGYWYGIKVLDHDQGFFNEWCAMFVAWCSRQAGIPKSIINNACYAHAGSNSFYFNITYHSRGNYTPKPGDLIFFDWAYNDRNWDHVGIVLYVVGNRVYTVEGNANEKVLMRDFSVNDSEIQGYGAPQYTNAVGAAIYVSSYPTPTRTLEYGSSGNDVRWLQSALLHLGYPSPIDGTFGYNTQRQLKKFQKRAGLEQSGKCGSATREAVIKYLGYGPVISDDPSNFPVPTRTLRVGCKGSDVKWLQAVLKKLGASISIDGEFGPATKEKVIAAQNKLGLTADGVVGPATRKKLIDAIGGSSGGSGGQTSTDPNDYPVPTRVLRLGLSGNDVRWLQAVLKKYGFSMSVTGYFGEVTQSNVKKFQQQNGLSPDGLVGPATRSKLVAFLNSSGGTGSGSYPVPTRVLKVGCQGDDVKWLQSSLKQLGYSITVDGIFGNGTKSKVIAFQKSAGLTQDGIVGPVTRKAIKDRL